MHYAINSECSVESGLNTSSSVSFVKVDKLVERVERKMEAVYS